ncbi:hypothetical protein K469DRAFT_719360, partial [Zopfia rhizophila CBS 207.26]
MKEGPYLGNLTLGYTFLLMHTFVSAKAGVFGLATSFGYHSLVAESHHISPCPTAIYAFKV